MSNPRSSRKTSPAAESSTHIPRRVIMASGWGDGFFDDIIRMSGKKHPKVLIIAAASGDQEQVLTDTHSCFAPFTKYVTDLLTIPDGLDPRDLRKAILKSDVIWVCGGWTERLNQRIDHYYLQEALQLAAERGAVMCGSSAGGICWSYAGFNDFEDDGRYDLLRGFHLEHVFFCPHYPAGRWSEFDKRLKEQKDPSLPSEAWALENGTAIFFEDGKPDPRIYIDTAKVYHFVRDEKGKWNKTMLKKGR